MVCHHTCFKNKKSIPKILPFLAMLSLLVTFMHILLEWSSYLIRKWVVLFIVRPVCKVESEFVIFGSIPAKSRIRVFYIWSCQHDLVVINLDHQATVEFPFPEKSQILQSWSKYIRGSEYHTCPVFKWSKVVWPSNGLIFKCYLNTGLPFEYGVSEYWTSECL